jgi:hypothetical protein
LFCVERKVLSPLRVRPSRSWRCSCQAARRGIEIIECSDEGIDGTGQAGGVAADGNLGGDSRLTFLQQIERQAVDGGGNRIGVGLDFDAVECQL